MKRPLFTQVRLVHYVFIAVVVIAVILIVSNSGSDEPSPESLERAEISALREALEGRVDELSDDEILELWKTLRRDMKRRERRGVIFSERLKLEAEQEHETREDFDRELQRELVALEESSSE